MSDDVEQVRAQILQTREALAETTTALAAKADVKGRASAKVKEQQQPIAVAGGVLALVVALLVWRKRRKRK